MVKSKIRSRVEKVVPWTIFEKRKLLVTSLWLLASPPGRLDRKAEEKGFALQGFRSLQPSADRSVIGEQG